MGFELVLLPEVATDLRDISAWYETHHTGLGDDFADAFVATLPLLRRNPLAFAPCYRDFRHVMMKRFPYGIYFRVVDSRVIVFRIFHGARNRTTLHKSLRETQP